MDNIHFDIWWLSCAKQLCSAENYNHFGFWKLYCS